MHHELRSTGVMVVLTYRGYVRTDFKDLKDAPDMSKYFSNGILCA